MSACEEVDWRRAVWAAVSRPPDQELRDALRPLLEAIDHTDVVAHDQQVDRRFRSALLRVLAALDPRAEQGLLKGAAQALLESLTFCGVSPSVSRAKPAVLVALRICQDPSDSPPARSAREFGLRPDQVTPQEKEWVLALVKFHFAGKVEPLGVAHMEADIDRVVDRCMQTGELRPSFPRVRITMAAARYIGVYFEERR